MRRGAAEAGGSGGGVLRAWVWQGREAVGLTSILDRKQFFQL